MSEKFNNMSFRTKLLLSYIAVIILCIIIFGLTVFSSISRRFENEITDNNAQITGLAVNNMTNTMNNIEQILYSVQANSTIEKMLTASNPPSPYEEIAAPAASKNSVVSDHKSINGTFISSHTFLTAVL